MNKKDEEYATNNLVSEKDDNNNNHHNIDNDSNCGETDSNSFIYPADGLTIPVALDVIKDAAVNDNFSHEITGEEDDSSPEALKRPSRLFIESFRQTSPAMPSKNASPEQQPQEILIPVTLTSRMELFAWWIYYFSYAPVSAVAMVLLIPLLLQDLARRAGYIWNHPDQPCLNEAGEICVLWKWGTWSVTPSAFAYYIIGLSVASQALVFISVGALADYGRMRKGMLALCTWLGSFCAICMATVAGPSYVHLAAILTIVLNLFHGTASVFYNAYLPLLVQNHPKYLEAVTNNNSGSTHQSPRLADQQQAINDDTTTATTNNNNNTADATANSNSNNTHRFFSAHQRRVHKTSEKLSSFISTMGVAAGNCAGVLVILLVILFFQLNGTSGMALQLCIAFCGLWWLVFSAFSLWHLKYRPGPPLPAGSSYLTFSWKKLAKTIKKCRKLPTTFSFLSCYLFYSDGYNTMGSAAILIARQSLNVGIAKLTICALIAPICAIIGIIVLFFLQKTFKISSKSMLISILLAMAMIPIYCACGLVTTGFGLRQEWEIYAITSVYGFLIGAAQSFSRVLFAELIPVGEESEFFSLYAVTDKGSAFLGPMVIAILSDYTNEPRFGLLFLAALIIIPIPFIIAKINLSRGKQECIKFIQQAQSTQSQENGATQTNNIGYEGKI